MRWEAFRLHPAKWDAVSITSRKGISTVYFVMRWDCRLSNHEIKKCRLPLL